jgi:DNA-binding response OmpR family regulator
VNESKAYGACLVKQSICLHYLPYVKVQQSCSILIGRVLKMAETKKTILVVDDDKSILRTFTRILEKSGYDIDVAETGKEAIEKAENHHYDLALVDIRLPDMDGTDLLAKLKKQLQNTVKIMITGFPSLETGVKALDEGADAYLVKPVKPQELLALLEQKTKK